MSVTPEVQQFINKSLADNNKALLYQISKLVADSADKRASVEAADEQMREIKKLRRKEQKSFKQEDNELQFNAKLQDSFDEAKSHLEVNAIDKAKEALAEVNPFGGQVGFGVEDRRRVRSTRACCGRRGREKKSVVQKKALKRRSSPRLQD